MRKCSKCGLPIGPLNRCPACGWDNTETEQDTGLNKIKDFTKRNKLSIWNLLLVIMCNVSLIAVLVNVCIGAPMWCHYAVIGIAAAYFITFTCFSKSVRLFITRYRNSVFFLNVACMVFYIVLNLLSSKNADVNCIFEYFVSANILTACIVFLCALFCRNVNVLQVLLSLCILLAQIIAFLAVVLLMGGYLEVIPVFGIKIAVPLIFTAAVTGICLLTCLNLGFIYFLKFRNCVSETFRLWE